MTVSPDRMRRRVLLSILSVPLSLIVAEVSARIWVRRYAPERIEQMTTHSLVRGRFSSYPYEPYGLNPAFKGHNALGFRGEPFQEKKAPGVRRLACVGASTTYGSLDDAENSYPAQLGKLMKERSDRWEVINAGVLGWLSTESLIDLQLRVLPLDPDVVVILPGRNEIFPQTYNGFKPDYTHFRRPGFNFTVSNYVHKNVFKWSRLALLACTVHGERFGWCEADEHPLYGGLVRENRPTPAEALRNSLDPARRETLRRSLVSMIEICRGHHILVLVCTMQNRPEKFALDELDSDPELNVGLGQLVERDNELIREVAGGLEVPLVETARLSDHVELFLDDAHLTLEGHRQQARMILEVLRPLLGDQ